MEPCAGVRRPGFLWTGQPWDMPMTTSARTSEGDALPCPLCQKEIRFESAQPAGEVPCPHCGKPLWFIPAQKRCLNYREVSPLLEKIIPIISDKLGVNKEQIKSTSTFLGDLGADSLDVVELIMDLEEKFKITIPDEEAEHLKTVADLVNY